MVDALSLLSCIEDPMVDLIALEIVLELLVAGHRYAPSAA